MSFSSPIYGDYNGIFLIFIRVTLQNLRAPVSNRSGIFHFEKSAVFRLQVPFTSPHSLSVNESSSVAPGKTIRSRSMVLRHKVANTPYISPMARTEYRYCALLAVILGCTQNLHFAGNGWFMQRRSDIYT